MPVTDMDATESALKALRQLRWSWSLALRSRPTFSYPLTNECFVWIPYPEHLCE